MPVEGGSHEPGRARRPRLRTGRNRVIRSTVVIGPDGRILKHWPKVKNAEEGEAESVATVPLSTDSFVQDVAFRGSDHGGGHRHP
jgi:hypothetical protein